MRRQPVAFALIDAAFLADSKFRALRRRLPEPRDYNSAVGAWLIVLTAARRNGLPEIDAAEEAEDPTFLPDLLAVGLLMETGLPEKPFRAWAPARPRYPSDIAPSAPDVTSAPNSPFTTAGVPSTHFPSHQLNSKSESTARARTNTVRSDPHLAAMAALADKYYSENGTGPTRPSVTVAEQEREAHRKAAFELHERHQAGDLTTEQYELMVRDLGKEPDDLTVTR